MRLRRMAFINSRRELAYSWITFRASYWRSVLADARSSFGTVSSWSFIAAQSRKGVAPALGARQGQAKAKGKYKGRAEDTERNAGIAGMIAAGQSWNTIQSATGCSRATIAKIAKRLKVAA